MVHLQANGFKVDAREVVDVGTYSAKHGVPYELSSCHTAIVDGYVVEGHVPADVIRKLLAERPNVVGVTVPGMPIGSPGMETPGRAAERYDVLAFDKQGHTTVFARR